MKLFFTFITVSLLTKTRLRVFDFAAFQYWSLEVKRG